eukprot:CAMPEP_0116122142 /NCGR_PEP_ID=MMETSP0329-20121206/4059_1 /TAXON_ID=697910 /ORGANISM="Pseudo-nitzschia arenysensis, Strain B593" /LENGTH=870 /DNA_ID=CAMNT_0003615975 /DNA_START=96 /DNA_END=2708 /DNA_ORIENTATION=-
MVSSNNMKTHAACGVLSLLIVSVCYIGNNGFASAFVPQNMQRLSQQTSFQPSITKTTIFMSDDTTAEDDAAVIPDNEPQARKSRLVWLTGFEDLRIDDHGGFQDAFSKAIGLNGDIGSELIVPVFVMNPEMHLRSRSESALKRLHESLASLERSISSLSSPLMTPLVVRSGSPSEVLSALAKETNAISCHVVQDDVVVATRSAQQSTCSTLSEMGIDVIRWSNRLRSTAPWTDSNPLALPSFFPEYCEIADALPVASPDDGTTTKEFQDIINQMVGETTIIRSEGVPSFRELVEMAKEVTPDTVLKARSARQPYLDTTEPFDAMISENWSTEKGAKKALKEYCLLGNDAFTDRHFIASDAANKGFGIKSMYASSIARILKSSTPKEALALREGPTRAFSSALNLGAISPRDALDAARNRSPVTPPYIFFNGNEKAKDLKSDKNRAGLLPSDNPFWGRSSEGSLSDVVEWREWFHLLAERSLSLQEKGEPATSGGEKGSMTNLNNKDKVGDPRESGTVNYWRWKGQHLVRYLTFPAGKDYEEQDEESRDPAILLVHGFAASGEQYERLVHSYRQQKIAANDGKDTTPPIYAVDLLGFGHSEKPGLSYTQYLWESQLVDFAMEVMEAVPMVMVGNSIGGGLSAGAAASLGTKICRGLVLLNTAGVLLDPDTYAGFETDENVEIDATIDSFTKAALAGNPEKSYSPIPLLGNRFLDVWGSAIIGLIYPQIEKRLSLIYGNRIENADPAVVYAIQQGASSPGSPNVIGSGQKLAPNRPLNEVLYGVDDESVRTLVVMGLNDQVSSPQVAKTRAELFSRLNPDSVTLKEIEGSGHCPHDETPEMVANHMLNWMESSAVSVATAVEKDEEEHTSVC